MRIRTALAALVVSTVAVGTPLALIPTASASPISDRVDLAACVQARLRVGDAGREANAVADALAAAQATIDAALKADVTAAQARLDAAVAAVQKAGSAATPAQVKEVADAEANLQAKLQLLENKATSGKERDALVVAKAKLRAALENADKVCDDRNHDGKDDNGDGNETTTTTPAPTTTMAPPVTVTVLPTPATADNGANTVLPRGGVDTGDGSTE